MSAAFHARNETQQGEGNEEQNRLDRPQRKKAQRLIKNDAKRVVCDEDGADIRLEGAVVLRHTADIGREQRPHAKQPAQDARRHTDEDQRPFGGSNLFFAALPREHLHAQRGHHDAEYQLDGPDIRIFQHQRAGDASRKNQDCQRKKNLRIKASAVFPGEDQVRRIPQQQVDRGDTCVRRAETQNGCKHQRVGKAAEPFDEICRKRCHTP